MATIDVSDLKFNDPAFSETPLPTIKYHLDRLFGKDAWLGWEEATIAIELGFIPDQLLSDKINALQIMGANPGVLFESPILFLYVTEVVNNHPVDFETLPMPTSLELAKMISTYPGDYSIDIRKTISYLLREDGYSYPVFPFTEDHIVPGVLKEGAEPQDMTNREAANRAYLKEGVK